MSSKLDELLNDLAGSKFVAELVKTLEDDEKRAKFTRTANVLFLSFASRRALRKGLSAAGLSDEQAKLIGRAIPYAAFLIGSNFTTGQAYAEDTYDDLYDVDDSSD